MRPKLNFMFPRDKTAGRGMQKLLKGDSVPENQAQVGRGKYTRGGSR